MKQGGKKIPGRGTSVCKDAVMHRVARPLQTCGQSTVGGGQDGAGEAKSGSDLCPMCHVRASECF